MKTVGVFSHKGGVGKTTISLLLAKYAAGQGDAVCVVDFDFIGSGMADLFVLKKLPSNYLESYFLDADPHGFEARRLLGKYTDKDLNKREFEMVLNQGKGISGKRKEKELLNLEAGMMGLMANELHYREIRTKAEILFGKLEDHGTKLLIIDCHPGLDFLAETIRPLVDISVYVTTPNRSDCFDLLKAINRKRLDHPNAFLVVNQAEDLLTAIETFRLLLEKDPVVGNDAQTLLGFLQYIGSSEEHFAVIPESETLRTVFYLGGPGYLPTMAPFDFCPKILSLV